MLKGTGSDEHCQCNACKNGVVHTSCCAVHNEPAYPNGPCDCGIDLLFEDRPVFTVTKAETGHRWEIYADGRITGFGDGVMVLNLIPLTALKYYLKLTNDKSESTSGAEHSVAE